VVVHGLCGKNSIFLSNRWSLEKSTFLPAFAIVLDAIVPLLHLHTAENRMLHY
jgi:hypothetical protein